MMRMRADSELYKCSSGEAMALSNNYKAAAEESTAAAVQAAAAADRSREDAQRSRPFPFQFGAPTARVLLAAAAQAHAATKAAPPGRDNTAEASAAAQEVPLQLAGSQDDSQNLREEDTPAAAPAAVVAFNSAAQALALAGAVDQPAAAAIFAALQPYAAHLNSSPSSDEHAAAMAAQRKRRLTCAWANRPGHHEVGIFLNGPEVHGAAWTAAVDLQLMECATTAPPHAVACTAAPQSDLWYQASNAFGGVTNQPAQLIGLRQSGANIRLEGELGGMIVKNADMLALLRPQIPQQTPEDLTTVCAFRPAFCFYITTCFQLLRSPPLQMGSLLDGLGAAVDNRKAKGAIGELEAAGATLMAWLQTMPRSVSATFRMPAHCIHALYAD